eukprot:363132-Chlamydomonas_euryale.AAC.3
MQMQMSHVCGHNHWHDLMKGVVGPLASAYQNFGGHLVTQRLWTFRAIALSHKGSNDHAGSNSRPGAAFGACKRLVDWAGSQSSCLLRIPSASCSTLASVARLEPACHTSAGCTLPYEHVTKLSAGLCSSSDDRAKRVGALHARTYMSPCAALLQSECSGLRREPPQAATLRRSRHARIRRAASGSASGDTQDQQIRKKPGSDAWHDRPAQG